MIERKARFLPSAIADLAVIHAFIARDSEVRADGHVDALVDAIERHAALGLTGHPRDNVRNGLKVLPFGDYCIHFDVSPRELIVRRVVKRGARHVRDRILTCGWGRVGWLSPTPGVAALPPSCR
jgi:plasmid stabilization system protein ParE